MGLSGNLCCLKSLKSVCASAQSSFSCFRKICVPKPYWSKQSMTWLSSSCAIKCINCTAALSFIYLFSLSWHQSHQGTMCSLPFWHWVRSCAPVGPGSAGRTAGLEDPGGSFPSWMIPWFCNCQVAPGIGNFEITELSESKICSALFLFVSHHGDSPFPNHFLSSWKIPKDQPQALLSLRPVQVTFREHFCAVWNTNWHLFISVPLFSCNHKDITPIFGTTIKALSPSLCVRQSETKQNLLFANKSKLLVLSTTKSMSSLGPVPDKRIQMGSRSLLSTDIFDGCSLKTSQLKLFCPL